MITGLVQADPAFAIQALAERHQSADGIGIQLLHALNKQGESLARNLPDGLSDHLDGAVRRSLEMAVRIAADSRGMVPDQSDWLNSAVTTTLGAVGGAAGFPGVLAELPVTTTILMRAIQGVAAEYGFDPASPEVQKQCLAVFACAGPLRHDGEVEMAFLAARTVLTGASAHGLILRVAPRFSAALSQKLAAQTVPVLGAVMGAAVNYAYTTYYTEMARIQFGLLRLAEDSGREPADLAEMLRKAMAEQREA